MARTCSKKRKSFQCILKARVNMNNNRAHPSLRVNLQNRFMLFVSSYFTYFSHLHKGLYKIVGFSFHHIRSDRSIRQTAHQSRFNLVTIFVSVRHSVFVIRQRKLVLGTAAVKDT